MSSKYKIGDNAVPHFITSTVVGWLDALSRPTYKDIILDSLRYCIDNKGLRLHAWVIMNNHLHLIVSTANADINLADIIRDFKKFTSKNIMLAIKNNTQESRKEWMMNMFAFVGKNNGNNNNLQFWQQDYHPIELNTAEKLTQRLNYLHENPVRAGIVWEAPEYKYSSAIDYYTNKTGLLPLDLLV